MDKSEAGRVSLEAAQVYDRFYLPALFSQWPPQLLGAANVGSGSSVLDIACGTGVLSCQAHEIVGESGNVTAIDINPDMLAVARGKPAPVHWILGDAAALPFPDNAFDASFNQFGLMFFPDRPAALREMHRVTRPGGSLVVAVWDKLPNTPGYHAMVGLLDDLFGNEVAKSLTIPFCLGDLADLEQVLDAARLGRWSVSTRPGKAVFPSLEEWVRTDVKGWTAADQIDEKGFDMLLKKAPEALGGFVLPDGSVEFDAPVHLCSLVRT